MTGSRAYRGERCTGGQPVYTPDGDMLDKHLHVLRRAPGGFDWGPEADEARLDQLAIALLADSAGKNIALDHYKEFAQYLREELEGNEWRLPTSDISAGTWSRDIDVVDETPSPKAVDIATVDFEEMSFAVERALCEEHDISVHQSVDGRRAELETARETARVATDDFEESPPTPAASSSPQPASRLEGGVVYDSRRILYSPRRVIELGSSQSLLGGKLNVVTNEFNKRGH